MTAVHTKVVVIGGGIAGLVGAWECAVPGFEVTLLESTGQLGGCVASIEVAGLTLDAGAESFATRGGHVATLLDDLGLSGEITTPNPAGAWVRLPGQTVPLPKAGLLGIPSSPLATDVIRAIGWSGALRAYLDRIMPVLKIGQERNLGQLVRKRMGRAVLERLVAPVVTGVYSAAPDELDIAVVAPGLNAALTRQGSLSGAVSELRGGGASKAGSAVGGIVGGMSRLTDALASAVRDRGGVIRVGTTVARLERQITEADDEATDGADTGAEKTLPFGPPRWRIELADGELLEADCVLIAAPALASLALLDGVAPELSAAHWPEASSVELATLVIDLPALSIAPRGTGVLVADAARVGVTAKALTHSTAKWDWLAEAAGVGRGVVRLSYGRAGRQSETATLDDSAFQELARTDASTLLDIPIPESSVIGFGRTTWTNALPFAALGERDRIAQVRESVQAIDGVEVTGAWLTGTGLASVIPDAREAAHRIRAVRWKELAEEL